MVSRHHQILNEFIVRHIAFAAITNLAASNNVFGGVALGIVNSVYPVIDKLPVVSFGLSTTNWRSSAIMTKLLRKLLKLTISQFPTVAPLIGLLLILR